MFSKEIPVEIPTGFQNKIQCKIILKIIWKGKKKKKPGTAKSNFKT